MKKISFLICNLALIFFNSNNPAYAGEKSYECKIQQIKELSNEGEITSHAGKYKYLAGQSFTVNRDTGEMTGLPFSTESYKEVTVLDRGGKENSYKAFVISYPPNIWIKYIYIKEFQEGVDKPFWGTEDGDKIFSGTCS